MLAEQIDQDYIRAMKSKDGVRSGTLSFLRAQLKNLMIEKKTKELGDADVLAVIKKQVKQRQDSVTQYRGGGREDLAAKEEQELEILTAYLPKQMTPEEIELVVRDTIKACGATSLKDMGTVMKEVLARVGGKADSRTVSEQVKVILSTT